MECTYFIVPDHLAQSSSLTDAAFRLIVWILSKKNRDRIADFSYLKLQSDKLALITELTEKNYLQEDDTGLYVNADIMFEGFKELSAQVNTGPDKTDAYFKSVFDLIAKYSSKRLNFNNSKLRIRCDEFLQQGFTLAHVEARCIQLNSINPNFDWYELESRDLEHIRDVAAVTHVNARASVIPERPSHQSAHIGRPVKRQIQNQSAFMPSYQQIKLDADKMAEIREVYNYWYQSKRLSKSQYIPAKPSHIEKLFSLLRLHSVAELKRAVDGVEFRRDLVNKGRNFNDIFTNSADIEALCSLAEQMDVGSADSVELNVFNYWVERTQAASGGFLRMSVSQRDKLTQRLAIFSEEDLRLAVDGAQLDPYYQSVNYAFDLIFNDDVKVNMLKSTALNGKQAFVKTHRRSSNIREAFADMGISKLTVGSEAAPESLPERSIPAENARLLTDNSVSAAAHSAAETKVKDE